MKKYIVSLYCIAAVFGSASADVLFSEDFEGVSISGDSPISLFGWANDIAASDSRVYVGNSVWSWAGTPYTEAFYTTEGMGAGFTAFDLSSAPGLKLSVDNYSFWNGAATAGYLALQLNGSNWYVTASPIPTPTDVWTTHEVTFDPTASMWNTLTVSGTGSVGAGGAIIGSTAASDLAGTVTGVGYVVDRVADSSQDFDNIALFTPTVTTPPAAPNLQKVWMNGTTATLYWEAALTATDYIVKTASNPGGPYSPVANTTDLSVSVTNLAVGSTNYFVVVAENAAGEGDPSGEVAGVAQSYTIFADSNISWGDWLFSYKEAAFDGDTSTFYESPNPSGAYVGADFGIGNEIVPVEFRFHPTVGKDAALTLLDGAEFQGSNNTNATWDTLAIINFTPTVQWQSVFVDTTNAYRYIRLLFVNGNDTIHGTIGEIAFGTNIPPFKPITVSPVDGALIPGPTNVNLSAEIIEWDSEFDSAQLYLNGLPVVSNNTPSVDGTNLISYAAGELAIGSYTGKVVATGLNPSAAVTNEWTFEVIPTPSSVALKLWNINMAGNEFAYSIVADGTVVRAPSLGSDLWNNLISPYDDGTGGDTNEYTWLPTNNLTIVDANGVNPIGLKWTGTDLDWFMEPTPLDALFIGYFASAGFDNTMEISGLDPGSKYDIYCYFTWGWNENWMTYQITEGSGVSTDLWYFAEQDNVMSGTYSNLVRRQNYVVFTQLSPSPAGNIHINATSPDGGWSGLQIAEVPAAGPTVNPVIHSMSISGDMITLQWASETTVNYGIMRKTNLNEPSWTMVTNNIAGEDPTTTESVQASGADEEFYRIEGQ
jgi:hypothetical protein